MVARHRLLAYLALVALSACRARPEGGLLGAPEPIAPGVDLYRSTDSSLVEDAGPISVFLLRLDLARVTLTSALSNGEILHAETVDGIARRLGAVAAVNGGFFNRANGEPAGVLKVAGELVSDNGGIKGAVIVERSANGGTALTFDQLAAKMTMTFRASGRVWTVPIDGVDTTRARGKLMLYTPAYHSDTDTAPTGTEWVLDGTPLHVVDVHANSGHSVIPRQGAVLSFGGTTLPEDLAALAENVPVSFRTAWRSTHGLPAERLDRAVDIVNGAGLLRRDGEVVADWRAEQLSPETFVDVRNPRTLIGVDRQGVVWLAAVDGRQPDYSIGMNFTDLERLCDRLALKDALNLDGGGSTTMVVNGHIINRPSDPAGPRPVSDAIVVMVPADAGSRQPPGSVR